MLNLYNTETQLALIVMEILAFLGKIEMESRKMDCKNAQTIRS